MKIQKVSEIKRSFQVDIFYRLFYQELISENEKIRGFPLKEPQ